MIWLYLISVMHLFLYSTLSAKTISGTAIVIDGDTIKVGAETLRLNAIDAPESEQECYDSEGLPWSCGREATRAAAELTDKTTVSCEVVGTDKYGRILGECVVDGLSLNAELVRRGWAIAFVEYDSRYLPLQKKAEIERIGVWRGRFVMPRLWRKAQTESVASEREPSLPCQIKGNITREGKKIYHMPWHRDYQKTRINQKGGERWFCTERDALKAGWKRALR